MFRRELIVGAGAALSFSLSAHAQGESQVSHNSTKKNLSNSVCQIISAKGVGTGFFFQINNELRKEKVVAIVTNKHVANLGPEISIINSDLGGKPIHIPDFHQHAIFHPDKNVDLMMSLCGGSLHSEKNTGLSVATYENIPSRDILETYDLASEILVAGYPTGIAGADDGSPLFRKGICSSVITKRLHGRRLFMIDASIWGGSSGSPVILYDLQRGVIAGPKSFYLIGVVAATEEAAISEIDKDTHEQHIDTYHLSPNNLGICVAADAIYDLVNEAIKKFPELEAFGVTPCQQSYFQEM